MLYANYYYGNYIALLGVKANEDGTQVFAIRIISATDLSKVKDIDIIDPDTNNPVQAQTLNLARTVTLGDYVAVALNYSTGGADVYILRIDTGEVVKKYHYDMGANIVTDGTYLYIVALTSSGNQLIKVDPSTLTETQAQVSPNSSFLEYHNGYIYIMASDGLTVLDTNLNVVTTISIDNPASNAIIIGNKMYAIAYKYSTTYLYIIDLETHTLIAKPTITGGYINQVVVDIIPSAEETIVKILGFSSNDLVNGYYDVFGYTYALKANIKEDNNIYEAQPTYMVPKKIGYLGDDKTKIEILYIYYRPLLRKPDGTRVLQPAAPLIPRGICSTPETETIYVYSLNGYLYKINGTTVQEEIDVLEKIIQNLEDETDIKWLAQQVQAEPRDIGQLVDIAIAGNKLVVAKGSVTIIDLDTGEIFRHHAMVYDIAFIDDYLAKVSNDNKVYILGFHTLIVDISTNEMLYIGIGPAMAGGGGGITVASASARPQQVSMILNDKLYTDIGGNVLMAPRGGITTYPLKVAAIATSIILETEPSKVLLARVEAINPNAQTLLMIIDGTEADMMAQQLAAPYTIMHKVLTNKLLIVIDTIGLGVAIGRPILMFKQAQT